jgi:hypothetical protein
VDSHDSEVSSQLKVRKWIPIYGLTEIIAKIPFKMFKREQNPTNMYQKARMTII